MTLTDTETAPRKPTPTTGDPPKMAKAPQLRPPLEPADSFVDRHIGPRAADIQAMLESIGCAGLDQLVDETLPASIRIAAPLDLGPPRSEHETLAELRRLADRNQCFRSLVGMGYYDTITPPVIARNILENPGWYTQYTPYQAEISQGRLEALLNFQTMVCDLTALPMANASLLDEATAAAEAMHMLRAASEDVRDSFLVADDCHPQTLAVLRTRAEPLGIRLQLSPPSELAKRLTSGGAKSSRAESQANRFFGVMVQYPATDGRIHDYRELTTLAHDCGARVAVATDLLALCLLKAPGEFGADVAVGSSQRLGVPLGYGGPHAAFVSCREDLKRLIPGRLVGVSKDAHGRPAYRLAIQTREQHIRRDKATSNICTAQVLLAIMAGMYAIYHGPDGLRRIARRIHDFASSLAAGLHKLGCEIGGEHFFDTIRVRPPSSASAPSIVELARQRQINLRDYGDGALGISLDELTDRDEIAAILEIFNQGRPTGLSVEGLVAKGRAVIPAPLVRQSSFLTHPVFNSFHSETELLRYIFRLQGRDLSLAQSMIPLGSCTMKLNATSEMLPVCWPRFARMHPFAPADQAQGYSEVIRQLEDWLARITGFAAVSLQPNAGSQGEYAGLLAIRAFHAHRGESRRDVCLIPTSAHGTNPASAVTAGMRVVTVACDAAGNIDVEDLKAKAAENASNLAAIMVTYPSTHGVFEERIREICEVVHRHDGQVYMDGANMNAQLGLCRPADIGADVCHINLHKTFCIPHGGGGPGMGPICVAAHLAPFLPAHPLLEARPPSAMPELSVGPVSAAPFGSAGILPISWMYIAMMGAEGLTKASQVAILNSNYMARRLEEHYDVLFRGKNRRVAHEFIIDARPFEKSAGVKVEDIAKRLMDYGFHAPTMSFPVPGTLMIEPTESESMAELDRYCDALIAIREEIRSIEQGRADRNDNPLKHAPHALEAVTADDWPHAYSREQAAYPAPWVRERKFWPAVGRIDNVWGDRNLFCTCPTVEAS